MITVGDYLDHVLAGVNSLPTVEVDVATAGGMVVAEDILARHPVPPFTNSGMDGFAVRVVDVTAGVVLPVTNDVPAGANTPLRLIPGTTQRIMTGAPLPPGADAVVPVEDTDQPAGPVPRPDQVQINTRVREGRHIRWAGEDLAEGDLVLTAGSRLNASAIAAVIAAGHGTVQAYRTPRVAVISTGSELVAAGTNLQYGQIPDSNGPLLAELILESGAEVVSSKRVSDKREAFSAALEDALRADLVVTSGGISAGAREVVRQVTEPLGVEFRSVAMQPGKPQGYGWIPRQGRFVPLFALPGNPVSVYVSFHLFVRPLLERFQGRTQSGPVVYARTEEGWQSPAGRRQFTPVRVKFGAEVTCKPVHSLGSGSHLAASLASANGLAVVPEYATEVDAGQVLPVHLVNMPWT